MIPQIVSVAKAKAHLSEIAREAREGKIFEVINRSQPMAIILSVENYKALLKEIEDLEDAIAILEGKLESEGKPHISWEQVKAEYWAEHSGEAQGA
jgi:prevent-host-death family protein